MDDHGARWEAAKRVAARNHQLLHVKDLRELGFSKQEVHRFTRAGRLSRALPNVYSTSGMVEGWMGRLAAACRSTAGVACRRSAAHLHGIYHQAEIEVVTLGSYRRIENVNVHRTKYLPEEDVMYVQDVPTTSPARTLLDLGAVWDEREVRNAMLRLLQLKLITADDPYDELLRAGRSGRNGVGELRKVVDKLDLWAALPESDLEQECFELLLRQGFPVPERQFLFADGAVRRYLDLAYPRWKIGIEADGWEAHNSRAQFISDRTRQNLLVSYGWNIFRFTEEDRKHPASFLDALSRLLPAEAW